MTTSREVELDASPPALLDDVWRRRTIAAQDLAVDGESAVVSSPAPYGVGGLGRHMAEIADALRRQGGEPLLIDERVAGTPATGRFARRARLIGGAAPALRLSPQMRMWAASARFDFGAAAHLQSAEQLIAFNGTALAQFDAARAAGIASRVLVSANSHYRHVVRQHAAAHRRYPIERPWPNRLLARNLREYERAERILVSSRYVKESFIEQGVAESRLVSFPLTPDERYTAPAAGEDRRSETFDVVFVGSLVTHKGVPLLLEAFARLPHSDMRLVLVGGWKTTGMRRHVERARARDPRIVVSPGDPLAHLRRARLCAHPAFEDGFGYAPAEALACGVPTLVSEDTGMKELIAPGRSGLVLATGDLDALTGAIEASYRGEILSG